MIEANIVADSMAPCGKRLITFVLTYPRFIHAEVMTHRVFSRNAASSRAIPVSKMIERIRMEPATPVYWGKNQKGMQANEELDEDLRSKAIGVWYASCAMAIKHAEELIEIGVHKQIANRILEPYAHMTTIVSGTEWGNFFTLRAHPDVQPEFQKLAYLMLELYLNSEPKQLKSGEWHLPFADKHIHNNLNIQQKLKIVTARCARVSYLNFDGAIDFEKDYKLHDDLLEAGHMSPFEHAARAENHLGWSGNFNGFTQYRKMLFNENRVASRSDLEQILANWEK